MTPFYKFSPQIQLKEYLFYKKLNEYNSIKMLYILNKKQFCLTSYLKVHTRYFTKKLPGGLNSLLLVNSKLESELHVIDQTSILLKKSIKFNELQTYNLILETTSIIFFISLSNYVIFYNIFKYVLFVRL